MIDASLQVRASSASAAFRSGRGLSCVCRLLLCCRSPVHTPTAERACACSHVRRSASGARRGAEKVPNFKVALRRSLRFPVMKRACMNFDVWTVVNVCHAVSLCSRADGSGAC